MNIDFAIAVAVVLLSALVLHFKSHVKFVALGAFVGLVLANFVPLEDYFANESALSFAKTAILVLPALVLGVNHTVDKHRSGIIRTVVFVAIFTLFFLSSLLVVLPENLTTMVTERSILAWQIAYFNVWLTVAAAVLVLADSFHHKAYSHKMKHKK